MADKLTRIEINCTTGKVITHELTPAEIAERDQMAAQAVEERAEQEILEAAKADAKLSAQAKLQALGLSGEEIAALG